MVLASRTDFSSGASVALAAGQGIVGMIILKNPDIVYQRWMGFVAFQVVNALSECPSK